MLTILGQPSVAASRSSGVSTPEDLQRALDLFAAAKDRHGIRPPCGSRGADRRFSAVEVAEAGTRLCVPGSSLRGGTAA